MEYVCHTITACITDWYIDATNQTHCARHVAGLGLCK